jgi:hypothetical protein
VAAPAPVPFRIKLPTEEVVEFTTYREVTTRVEGLLHLEEGQVVLEWAMRREVQEVGLSGVVQENEAFDPEVAELPLSWITSATLAGGIISPRLVLRGRSLQVFAGIPGAKGAEISLHYTRNDRMLAVAMVRAIEDALAGPVTPLP